MNNLPTGLYTAEGGDSAKQTNDDLKVADPTPEQAKAAIQANAKPWDCTCEYPAVRVRNGCGHPRECRYYSRWAKERGR